MTFKKVMLKCAKTKCPSLLTCKRARAALYPKKSPIREESFAEGKIPLRRPNPPRRASAGAACARLRP